MLECKKENLELVSTRSFARLHFFNIPLTIENLTKSRKKSCLSDIWIEYTSNIFTYENIPCPFENAYVPLTEIVYSEIGLVNYMLQSMIDSSKIYYMTIVRI